MMNYFINVNISQFDRMKDWTYLNGSTSILFQLIYHTFMELMSIDMVFYLHSFLICLMWNYENEIRLYNISP